jgi:hypothetical protein
MPDGRVLIAAGQSDTYNLTSAEIYDPATGNFTTTASLGTARASHSATLMPDGTVLAVGGEGGPVDSAENYDPASGTWTYVGDLITARSAHSADLLEDGSLLIVGGYGSDGGTGPSQKGNPDFAGHKALTSSELGTETAP